MSVWLCIPSKRPAEEAEKCLKLWRERGYKIALWRDDGEHNVDASRIVGAPVYPGYARAANTLVALVLLDYPDCDWIVTGGDDVEPDPNHSAEEIAWQCSEHFGSENHLKYGLWKDASTFGVMQPTADSWGDRQGPYIERVCGSPWIGREFALRINQGHGPLWPEYWHMGEDEELQAVAEKYGVLWQRPDLTHFHNHWGRVRGQTEDRPAFLDRANSGEEWRKYKQLFAERKAAGFPGSQPL